MATTYFSALLKDGKNAVKLFHAIKAMGLNPACFTAPYPNGRGLDWKVYVNEITEEQKETISAKRAEIEPLF